MLFRSTGYIRPSTGYIRSTDRKFRCGADISAQSSGAPERSICELLASGLSEILVHRIYPAPRPEVPVGADISAQSSGAHDATICELLFKVLSENGEGRIYPGSTPDISGGDRIFPVEFPVRALEPSGSFAPKSLAKNSHTGYIRSLDRKFRCAQT